jgi:hypothetical protein
MTEKIKEAEVPRYRVTQAPGFATGLVMHPPGTEIEWQVPHGWDSAKYGKHYAEYGPSVTFEPLNDAAKKHMEEHHKEIKAKAAKAAPAPSGDTSAIMLQILNLMLEEKAERRRKEEKEAEETEKKGKK